MNPAARRLSLALVALAALGSCGRPSGFCAFTEKKGPAQQIYRYDVSVRDPVTAYETFALFRYDARKYPVTTVCLVVRYVADNGFEIAEEYVFKAVDAVEARRSGSVVDLRFALDSAKRFPRGGDWRVAIEIPNVELCRAADGFGYEMEMK